MKFDFHIHSRLSEDGKGTIFDYCKVAVERGFVELGFCEHLDLHPLDRHFNYHCYDKYLKEFNEAKNAFPSLKLRIGVEVSYLPEISSDIANYILDKEYDYVVGAVHLVEDGKFSISEEDLAREYFSSHSPEKIYSDYFELILKTVRSGLFDVLAHLDMVNRYALYYLDSFEFGKYYGKIRRILEGIIKRDMALEVNSSGFRQQGKAYPDLSILKLYKELGGQLLSFGSDAHNPDDLGRDLEKAVELAKNLGFTKAVSFEKRNIIFIEI